MSVVSRRVLLAFLWLGFVLLLLQGVGYLAFGLGLFTATGYGYPKDLHIEDAGLGFRLRPGFRGHFRGTAYEHIPIRTNQHGYRDDPFDAKRPGRRRVVVLGDSVVFGSGVAAEGRFTEQLESHSDVASRGIEALNLGVNRYTFGHYLVQAERDVPRLAPDAILVGFTLNDIKEFDPSAGLGGLAPTDEAVGTFKAARRYVFRQTYGGRFLRVLRKRIEFARLSSDEQEAYHTKWMRTGARKSRSEGSKESSHSSRPSQPRAASRSGSSSSPSSTTAEQAEQPLSETHLFYPMPAMSLDCDTFDNDASDGSCSP